MSYDEARLGFNVDAPIATTTNFYMLVGDNTYGYSFSGTNLSTSTIGDLDAYKLVLGVGTNYTIVATGISIFGSPVVISNNFALLNRNGFIVAMSTSVGNGFSGLTFTATDSLYYVQNYSSNAGYYGLRLENNSITEANGIGEVITAGRTYSAALDYVSDVDIYTFSAIAGVTYGAVLLSSIPDIFLDVEYSNLAVSSLVAVGSGIYTFTAPVTGIYELHISSDSYVNTGAYTIVTDLYNSSNPSPLIYISSSVNAIQSLAKTPDSNFLLIKIGGVFHKVATGSTLSFSDGPLTTDNLSSQYSSKVVPIFSSSGGTDGYTLPDVYAGPASLGLKWQLIESATNAVVVGSSDSEFIKVSSTNSVGKAVNGNGGNDVIDGGVGSTFVTGGAGHNTTFFLDGRAPGVSWSTITDFQLGTDKATIWGFVKGVSSVVTSFGDPNTGGAPGFQGLTLHFANLLPDGQTSGTNASINSITLSGHTLAEFGASSLADLNTQINNGTNAHLTIGSTQDAQGTHNYLWIH
jgi:hypothetical protein